MGPEQDKHEFAPEGRRDNGVHFTEMRTDPLFREPQTMDINNMVSLHVAQADA